MSELSFEVSCHFFPRKRAGSKLTYTTFSATSKQRKGRLGTRRAARGPRLSGQWVYLARSPPASATPLPLQYGTDSRYGHQRAGPGTLQRAGISGISRSHASPSPARLQRASPSPTPNAARDQECCLAFHLCQNEGKINEHVEQQQEFGKRNHLSSIKIPTAEKKNILTLHRTAAAHEGGISRETQSSRAGVSPERALGVTSPADWAREEQNQRAQGFQTLS